MKKLNSRKTTQWRMLVPGMLILLFALIGCDSSTDSEPIKEDKDKNTKCDNSTHKDYKILVQGKDSREYILHVPANYNSDTATPLIINFHGFGGCASYFAKNTGEKSTLNNLADVENFIVAYPQAIIREKGSPAWYPDDKEIKNIKDNDVYFTEQLINEIKKDYNVDLTRVYATGFSNGGMMAYGLACAKGELFAAIGVMSGTMLDQKCNSAEQTSVIIFHGIDDAVLPYDGNQFYQSVDKVVNFWLGHNNIPKSSKKTNKLNDGKVVRDAYIGGKNNTSVVLYTVHEEYGKKGGHVWFSDDIDGKSPNKILWDFLYSYKLEK